MIDKYKLIGLASAAVAAAACFMSYFVGGPDTYGAALAVAAAAFFVTGAAELCSARKRDRGNKTGSGALLYMKPALFFILSALTVFAAVWFFIAN